VRHLASHVDGAKGHGTYNHAGQGGREHEYWSQQEQQVGELSKKKENWDPVRSCQGSTKDAQNLSDF
jgi:hypothetical protein